MDADESIVEQYVLHDGEYKLAMKSSSGRLTSRVVAGFDVEIEAFFDAEKNVRELTRLVVKDNSS